MTCLLEVHRSASSVRSLFQAAGRCRRITRLCLIHVIPSGRAAEVEAGRRVLQEALRALRGQEREVILEGRLEIGSPADTLLRVAEEIEAELIVMAAHGEGEFPRLEPLGRRARATLEHGRRPVLLVSATETKLCRPRGPARRRRVPALQNEALPL